MYLHLVRGRGWEYWFDKLGENTELPELHEAHKEAFNKINWRLLSNSIEG